MNAYASLEFLYIFRVILGCLPMANGPAVLLTHRDRGAFSCHHQEWLYGESHLLKQAGHFANIQAWRRWPLQLRTLVRGRIWMLLRLPCKWQSFNSGITEGLPYGSGLVLSACFVEDELVPHLQVQLHAWPLDWRDSCRSQLCGQLPFLPCQYHIHTLVGGGLINTGKNL